MKSIHYGLLVIGFCFTVMALGEPTDGGPVQFYDGVHARFNVPRPAPPGEDPLAIITNEMSDIGHELGARKTGEPTQGKQKVVVSQLDEIIAELEKQCKGGGSGMSRNPSKPMQDSKIAKGPGGMGELIQPKADQKTIANLPSKERDRILQSKTEGFPPGYESLLSSYYTRLAQEKVNGEGADKLAGPSTQPVKP